MQKLSCNEAHTLFIETGCQFMNFLDKSNFENKLFIFSYQEFMKPKSTSHLNTIFGSLLSSMSINLYQYLNIGTFHLESQDDQPISPPVAGKGAYMFSFRKIRIAYVDWLQFV